MTPEAPAPLGRAHELSTFSSGEPALDDWLKRRALANQDSGATRTFVACQGVSVIAYYALAAGGVAVEQATGRFRRNMPDPIPVAILARLAIDTSCQGRGLGRALVRDAAGRVMNAAESLGIRGMLVHAMSPKAKAFYLAMGFNPSPFDPMMLMVSLADARQALATRNV